MNNAGERNAPKDEADNDAGDHGAEDTRQGKIKPVLRREERKQAFKHSAETWSGLPGPAPDAIL